MARRVRGQLIEALLDNLEDACLAVDRSGRIRFLNPAMRELFEVGLEFENEKFWDVLPINDFTRALSQQVKESDPTPVEQVVVLPGDRVFVAQIKPVMGEEGRHQGAIATLKDMAAVQKIEKGIDQFLVDINSQLRLPLTAIKGYVETLLEGAYTSQEVTRRFLQVINDETNRLARLVMSLEEASGKAPAGPATATELAPLLYACAEMFEQVAAQKNLALEVSISDGLPIPEVDADGLRKAVVNLIDNAVKCTGLMGYGKVRLQARLVDNDIVITVSDTGPGIPEAEQERIFEQFYRVTEGPAAELGGTGLGLAVVKEVAERHGGSIGVLSRPEQGATFTFVLPLQRPS
ncbi:MAG: PAS domain-containing protein [Candidatus Eremiobacteraeota bacterium]|nr:PAS domain-containing protein [Candidatus Eremiobacteraeota bacterium]